MRRDYFTCVFLGLIAGALVFVCFKPLYFIYGGIVPRIFSVFEILMSVLYALFFVFFLPVFAAYRKKYWINWGLVAYGILAYLPVWFYPADEMLSGNGASLVSATKAMLLQAVYGMTEAPFAALSAIVGDSVASRMVYWILPLAIFWPVFFKVVVFYRNAYLSELLTPASALSGAATAERQVRKVVPNGAPEPEVLGTVISAPTSAASPSEVSRKAVATNEPVQVQEQPERRVRPAVRPVHIQVPNASGTETDKSTKSSADDVIQLGAPRPSEDVIQLGPTQPSAPNGDNVINLGPPPSTGNSN